MTSTVGDEIISSLVEAHCDVVRMLGGRWPCPEARLPVFHFSISVCFLHFCSKLQHVYGEVFAWWREGGGAAWSAKCSPEEKEKSLFVCLFVEWIRNRSWFCWSVCPSASVWMLLCSISLSTLGFFISEESGLTCILN